MASPERLWVQGAVLVVLVVGTLVLLAYEWSQRWFLAASAVLLVLLGAYGARVGFRAERIDAFDHPIAQAIAERTQLTVAAQEAGVEPPAASGAAPDRAIDRACLAAQQASIEVAGCPPTEDDRQQRSERVDAGDAMHGLALALADHRSAIMPEDEEQAAAATAAATAGPPDLDRSLLTALSAGPQAMIGSLDSDGPLRLVPGPLGWALAGGALLLLARWLLQRNALQAAGPVSIEYAGDLLPELQLALLKNLKTPAAAPGAAVAQSVTDLTTLGGPQVRFAADLAKVLTSLMAFGRGYVVGAVVVPPPKPADGAPPGPTTVLVTITAASSKESLGNASFSDAAPEKAMRAAGLWAAGLLLGRSSRIPSWAGWSAATAQALDATTTEDPTREQLERAVRTAPTSGWILHLYGDALEQAGREAEAIAAYGRAVVAHPRYLIARYRLAAALGMLGRTPEQWATLETRARTVRVLEEVCDALGVSRSLATALGGDAPTGEQLHALAIRLLDTMADDARWWTGLAASLRRADRDQSWLAWRGRRTSRSSARWLALSGRLIYDRGNARVCAAVEAHALRSSSSWQVSYNVACSLAATDQDAAIEWLERSLRRPGAQQLQASWLTNDGDLKVLAGNPRFAAFVRQLDPNAKTGRRR
jgi:tetratricopeptide (TPR) repeat protein